MEQSTQDTMETHTTPVGEGMLTPIPPMPPTVAFTKVDNNLTGIGFFTASSKRSRKAIEKTTVVMDQGIEHRISILPSAKYGLPITQDQDYWLALMKLVADQLQREGKLTNPFTFTTAQILKILGQVDSGNNYKAVDEWLSVMKSTTVEGGAYNIIRKTWLRDKTSAVDRVITVGRQLDDGAMAEKNNVWFSHWQLDNINAGNLIPIELNTYTQLQTNIARNLVPHLQEWLFASQRDGRFEKQYEDICHLLGIRVYAYVSKIEEKFGPALDELVSHGYISKWAIERMANGKTYKLVLWHGKKFHRDQQHRSDRKQRAQISGAAGESATPTHRPRQRRFNLKPVIAAPSQIESAPAAIIDYRLVSELTKRGIAETDARAILASLPAGQAVLDQLEWGDLQISQSRGKLTNPPGFYISLLQRNVIPPPSFETSEAKSKRLAAELERQQALQKAAEAEQAAQKAAEAELNVFQTTQPDQYQAFYRQAQAELFAAHPKMADFARAHPGSSLHDGAIRARIRQLLVPASAAIPAVNRPETEQLQTPSENLHQATNEPTRQDGRLEVSDGERLFAAALQLMLMTLQLKAPEPLQQLPPATPEPSKS